MNATANQRSTTNKYAAMTAHTEENTMGITTRWNKAYTDGGSMVAEWLLDNPYTGPATAHEATDEWVHYPNGALKVRYKPVPESMRVMQDKAESGVSAYQDAFRAMGRDETMQYARDRVAYHNTPVLWGVRYVVPAELFQDPDALQEYVSERVAEFIANRDSYLMPDGKYHQGN